MSAVPPVAFRFAVRFDGQGADVDASFQEVSGIELDMRVESFQEGGENRFRHALPRGVKHPRLSLKRGTVAADAWLVKWCKDTLEGVLAAPHPPTRDLEVSLLDAEGKALRQWSFTQAYPVKWEVEAFNSTRNEVAIEMIELAYVACQRKT